MKLDKLLIKLSNECIITNVQYVGSMLEEGIMVYFEEKNTKTVKKALKKYKTEFTDDIFGTRILIDYSSQKHISEKKLRKINFKVQIATHPTISKYPEAFTPHLYNCLRYFNDISYEFKKKQIINSDRADKDILFQILEDYK